MGDNHYGGLADLITSVLLRLSSGGAMTENEETTVLDFAWCPQRVATYMCIHENMY